MENSKKQRNINPIVLFLIGLLCLAVSWIFWSLGAYPFSTKKDENLLKFDISLEHKQSFKNVEFKRASCKKAIQTRQNQIQSRAYILSNDSFLNKNIEQKLLAGNSIEFAFSDGLKQRRFRFEVTDGLEKYEDEQYIANITAEEINHTAPLGKKVYYGSLERVGGKISLNLVNNYKGKKNVILIFSLQNLGSDCYSETGYFIENIYNMPINGGNRNVHGNSGRTLSVDSCSIKNHSFTEDIRWPEVSSRPANINIVPVFLEAGAIVEKKPYEIDIDASLRNDNLKFLNSLKVMTGVQREIFCPLPVDQQQKVNLTIAGINAASLCDGNPELKAFKGIRYETNKEFMVNLFKYNDSLSSDLPQTFLNKFHQYFPVQNASNPSKNDFNIYLFDCVADCGNSKASILGLSKNRYWAVINKPDLTNTLLLHELNHLFGLTHRYVWNTNSKYSALHPPYVTSEEGPSAFHAPENLSHPQFIKKGMNLYRTVSASESDTEIFDPNAKSEETFTVPFPAEKGLECKHQGQVINFCKTPNVCNGAKNTLEAYGNILRFISNDFPSPLPSYEFIFSINNKVEIDSSIIVRWDKHLEYRTVLSTKDEAGNTITLGTIEPGTPGQKKFNNPLMLGKHKIKIDFVGTSSSDEHELQVVKPIAIGTLVENPDLDNGTEQKCNGKLIGFCNFQAKIEDMQCVGGKEFNTWLCDKNDGCDGDEVFDNKLSDIEVDNLFVIGSSDDKINPKFDYDDNVSLATRRGKIFGQELSSKLDINAFHYCPQINKVLENKCSAIGFNPKTNKYAAAFISPKVPSFKDSVTERCIPCGEDEVFRDNKCVFEPVTDQTTTTESSTIIESSIIVIPEVCQVNEFRLGSECFKEPVACKVGQILDGDNQCIEAPVPCPTGTERIGEVCKLLVPQCPDNQKRVNNKCAPDCSEGTAYNGEKRRCEEIFEEDSSNVFLDAVLLLLSLATLVAL